MESCYTYSFNMLFCNLLFSLSSVKYTKYFSILVPIDLARILKTVAWYSIVNTCHDLYTVPFL